MSDYTYGCGVFTSQFPTRQNKYYTQCHKIGAKVSHKHLIIVYSERNQQVMCGAGLAGAVLRVCGAALRGERHPLHAPAMYVLERLAAHALRPTELRYVGSPSQ